MFPGCPAFSSSSPTILIYNIVVFMCFIRLVGRRSYDNKASHEKRMFAVRQGAAAKAVDTFHQRLVAEASKNRGGAKWSILLAPMPRVLAVRTDPEGV